MGRHIFVFAFFALSTVAIILAQPGPRQMAEIEVATATEASRNELSALRPVEMPAHLPVPDIILAQIKQASRIPDALPAQTQSQIDDAVLTALNAPAAAVSNDAVLAAPAAAPAQQVFAAQDPAQPVLEAAPEPVFQDPTTSTYAPAPASSELRDMSWSALGQLKQLGHVSKAPRTEGSLLNSIVRRSMAHVDNPAAASVPTPAPALQPAVQPERVTALAPRPAAPAAPKAVQAAPQPRPVAVQSAGAIGKRESYLVVPGDNLALIAIKLYGSALATDRLLQDNPSLRSNPNSLRIGQVISYRSQ